MRISRPTIAIVLLLSYLFLWPYSVAIGGSDLPALFFVNVSMAFLLLKDRLQVGLFFVITAALVCYGVLQAVFWEEESGQYTLLIYFVLGVGVWGHLVLVEAAFEAREGALKKILGVSLTLLSVQCLAQFMGLLLHFGGGSRLRYEHYVPGLMRASGLLNEPSHVALAVSPIIAILIYLDQTMKRGKLKKDKRRLLAILLLVCVLAPSATLVAILVLAVVMRLMLSAGDYLTKIRGLLVFFMFSIVLVAAARVPEVNERISAIIDLVMHEDDASVSDNASALAFLKGFEMAKAGINSSLFGVGVLNMYLLNDRSEVSYLADHLYSLNSKDGSSLFFKLTAELGVLGVGIILLSFYLAPLRAGSDVLCVRLKRCFVFGLVCCYIRGTSYFDGVALIGLSSLLSLTLRNGFRRPRVGHPNG